jgi:hypothetical protein
VDRDRTVYRFSIPLLKDQRIPFIAPYDIGRFAAVVIQQPQRFKHGRSLILLTACQIAMVTKAKHPWRIH